MLYKYINRKNGKITYFPQEISGGTNVDVEGNVYNFVDIGTYVIDPATGYNFTTASATPWTPASITTDLWLDASDSSTITESSNKVSAWTDKGTYGRDTEQLVEGNKPTTNAYTINDLNTLFFNANHWMNAGSPTWLEDTEYFVIAVVENINYLSQNCFAGINGNDLRKAAIWGNSSGTDNYLGMEHLQGSGDALSEFDSGSTLYTPYMYGGHFQNTGSEIFRDGNSLGTDAGPDSTLTGITDDLLIGSGDPMQYAYEGYIGEVVWLTGSFTLDTRQRLEGYLAHKWGLTGKLPGDHPYKSSAPTT
jgi:hypothetical protein